MFSLHKWGRPNNNIKLVGLNIKLYSAEGPKTWEDPAKADATAALLWSTDIHKLKGVQ